MKYTKKNISRTRNFHKTRKSKKGKLYQRGGVTKLPLGNPVNTGSKNSTKLNKGSLVTGSYSVNNLFELLKSKNNITKPPPFPFPKTRPSNNPVNAQVTKATQVMKATQATNNSTKPVNKGSVFSGSYSVKNLLRALNHKNNITKPPPFPFLKLNPQTLDT